MWGADPLAAGFGATDWSELLDTAVLHGEWMWQRRRPVGGAAGSQVIIDVDATLLSAHSDKVTADGCLPAALDRL